ncbi:MAG: MFS transporter, partial [Halalkalicoccus sp.]
YYVDVVFDLDDTTPPIVTERAPLPGDTGVPVNTTVRATFDEPVQQTGITFGLPKLVAELFPPERTGSASTVYVLGSYAGSAGAFALGRPLLGPALGGWRPTFLYTGLATIVFALVWFAGTARIEPRNGDGADRGFSLGSLRSDARRVLSNPTMLLLVAIGTAYLSVGHGLQGWLVTLFESRGVAPALAGLTTTVLVAGQVAGALSIPPLSDRLSARRPAVVASGLLVTTGTLLLLLAESALPIAALGIVAVGIGLGGVGPLLRALPTEIDGIGPGLTATAVGFVFAVGEIGGFLGPVLVGSLLDLTGSFAPGLGVIACAGLVIAAAGWRMTGVDP